MITVTQTPQVDPINVSKLISSFIDSLVSKDSWNAAKSWLNWAGGGYILLGITRVVTRLGIRFIPVDWLPWFTVVD